MTNSDPNMILFEEKIATFQKENEEVQSQILRGSDEHLDILISIKSRVDPLTEKFSNLLIDLIPDSNKLTNEEVEKVMPNLLELYSSAIQLVAVLKRSSVGNDLKSCCQNYYSQVENLREFIYDLENFRLSTDDEIDKILLEINSK